MKTNQRSGSRVARISTLTTLVVIILLSCSPSTLGQWTTPDTSQNINSTNSGNVGVGTAAPAYKLEVQSPSRNSMAVLGDGDTVGYSGFTIGARTTTNIATNRTSQFNFVMRKDSWFGGDGSGPSLVIETVSKVGGYAAPFIITPTNNIILNGGQGASGLTYGNVGIGTTTPNFKLDLQGGSINSSGGLCIAGDCKTAWSQLGSQWSNNGTTIFYNSGHVGIGTNAPAFDSNVAKYLTVDGGANVVGSIGAGGGTSNAGIAVGQLAFVNTSLGTTEKRLAVIVGSTDTATNSGMIDFYTASGGTFTAPRIRINSNGNVGIGTTTPTQKLEVNGSALIGTIYGSSATSGVLSLQSTSHATKGTIQIGFDQTTTTSIGQSGTAGNKLLVATDRLVVNNGGVRVNGATDHGDLSVTKINITNADALQFRTSNPNIQSNGSLLFTAQNVGGDNVKFNVQNNSISNAFVIDTNSATPARLFDVRDLGTSKFTVAGNGNVGIGTNAPGSKLHVTGDITATGTIAARYQDVAEWVESSQELSSGMVVVLDHTKSNQVIASTQAYDSRVAGVISLKPGLMLGEAGEGRVLVATTGRVKVKVDATNGPIQIGDLLVTSDKAGFAMKSAPVDVGGVRIHRPGTLIGKALEPLAQGTGEILVLLSLQ